MTVQPARVGRRVFLAAALVVALAAFPSPASAHAELVSSTPADGVELAIAPTDITLVFSESPRLEGLSVRVFDRRGQEIPLDPPRKDAAFPTTVRVAIPAELRPGAYTVVWYVVSEEDAHPQSREFVFGIREPPGDPSVTPASLGTSGVTPLQVAAVFAELLAMVLLLGSATQARWFALREPRVVAAAAGGAVLLVAGGFLAVLDEAERTLPGTRSESLLDQASALDFFRFALLVGIVLAVCALALVARERARRRGWTVLAVLAAALAWSQAAGSHAAGVAILPWVGLAWRNVDLAIEHPNLYGWFGLLFDGVRQLNVGIGALHSVAIGAWIGGLVVVGLASPSRDELTRWHPRFSRFALAALVVVGLTGLYQAVLYLPHPDALVGSDYGVTLLAKHAFVLGVLAMAGLNRFVVGRALHGTSRLAWVAARPLTVVRLEAVLGVGVLGVTAALATTAPARPPTDIFFRPDIAARLAVQPAVVPAHRPGFRLLVRRTSAAENQFVVEAPEHAPNLTPDLTLRLVDGEIARRLPLARRDGAWVAEGVALTRDGTWQASVEVAGAGPISFPLQTRDGYALPFDADARAAWDAAIERTERDMRSARMVDQLTDGLSALFFGHHEFVAPDRERFEMQGWFTSVFIADQRYVRQDGERTWRVKQRSRSHRWPDWSFLRAAIGIVREGTGTQAGTTCDVYAGYAPDSGVTYEIWIGRDDGFIHRLVMGLPGHYMVNAYYDINAPITVEAPTGVAGGQTQGTAP